MIRMRWRAWVVTVLVGVVVGPAAAMQPVRYDGHRAVRVSVRTEAELSLLMSLTDDVWSEAIGVGALDVRVSPEQFGRLQASGLSHEVMIDDIQPLIDQQLAGAGLGDDPWAAYMPWDDLLEYLDVLVALRPDLAQLFVAGQSVEQRDIVGLRITGAGEGIKPGVLYHGGQHAREWITVPVALYVADHLIREYGADPDATSLVDRFEWFIIPVMNPDGYVYTWDVNRLWRKNRRHNGGTSFGVDLNRNWGVGWGGVGSSHDPNSDIYRGPYPFSEPETRAMRDWILDHPNIIAYSDLHNYSELIMYPFGYRADPPAQPDLAEYAYMAETMSDLVYSVHGKFYDYGPVYTTIYPCSGISVDWAYATGRVFAFSWELRDRGPYYFLLPPDQIRPNCEEVLPALLFYADYVSGLDCNGNGVPDIMDIRLGTSSNCNGNLAPDECDLAYGTSEDCNGNGIPDECDVADGTSPDCNGNGVPDECDPGGLDDCNNNGTSDFCDIYAGTSSDWNENGIPDDCDIADGLLADCQPNGVADHYEPVSQADECSDARAICPGPVYYGSTVAAAPDGSASCGNSNGTPDVWYYYKPVAGGQLTVALAGSPYDTVLSVHSGCPGTEANELACNDDYFGKQSRVQLSVTPAGQYWIRVSGADGAAGWFMLTLSGPPCAFHGDCNDNGIPDECERDCNGNGRPDDCDIADGTSQDVNGNGIPDECEIPGDLNCDGQVNLFDVDPFVKALVDPDGYAAQFPDCYITNGDVNGDGVVDGFDIGPFVELLVGS